jgi:hypothetical protein
MVGRFFRRDASSVHEDPPTRSKIVARCIDYRPPKMKRDFEPSWIVGRLRMTTLPWIGRLCGRKRQVGSAERTGGDDDLALGNETEH